MLSRLLGDSNSENNIVKRVDALIRFEEELKSGRAYTSGRSGVLGYIIPNTNANDLMEIRQNGVQTFAYTFTLPSTGSMSSGKSFKLSSIYRSLYQEYPVTSPYLEVWANDIKLTLNLQNNWTASDGGATWAVATFFSYLEEITDWNVPKQQSWQTFLTWFSTVPVVIKIKMRVKSTDKGTIENIAVIF